MMSRNGNNINFCLNVTHWLSSPNTLPSASSLLSSVILWLNSPSDSTLSERLKLAASVKTLIRFWLCRASAKRSSTSCTRWFIISTRTKAAVQINKDTNDTGQTSLGELLWADECPCFSAMTNTGDARKCSAPCGAVLAKILAKAWMTCDSCIGNEPNQVTKKWMF